ncbi:MAG: hypothetical protein KF861_07270 [Planctomycetaceae bacterium]|nr:hypothetical protein [Planctomycetaceae bacterium]
MPFRKIDGNGRPAPGRQTRYLFSIASLIVLITVGCGYGEVDPVTYQYARALCAACNLRDAARLETVATQIQAAVDRQELPSREAGWLNDIVSEARGGDWAAAEKSARRMIADQVHQLR